MNIGIIGYGFVGKATSILLKNFINNLYIYDIDTTKCRPKNIQFSDLKKMNLIFICLPTPMNIDGSCNTNLIKNTIYKLKKIINKNKTFIIVRSTVPVGFCEKQKVYFMPEFLTEKNWKKDFKTNKYWLVGDSKCNLLFRKYIKFVIDEAYKSKNIQSNILYFKNISELELLKLFKNTFLSTKVSFCNELYLFCQKRNINYNNVINMVQLDNRIGKSHLKVPGPDGEKGFGGTCLPKDSFSLLHQMYENNLKPPFLIETVLNKNIMKDRPLNWLFDGRSIVNTNKCNKNYLVTGGAGFIGSHLCKYLLETEKDINVFCLDNLITGNLNNLKEILDNKRFFFIKKDIVQPLNLQLNNIDKIYNLACIASPNIYIKYSLETLDTCYIGLKNILELGRKYSSSILHASTSEIYGDPKIGIQQENYWGNVNSFGERACYDEGKRIAETLCYNYIKKYNMKINLVRIFNTYGPNMCINDGRVIPNFINQCLENRDITVYGNGKQTRSFCYIDDTIKGIVNLIDIDYCKPVNIGNNNEITVLELAKLIKKNIKDTSSQIIFNELPQDDPKIRCPNLDLAQKLIDYKPSISLEQGLKRTIEYFKNI